MNPEESNNIPQLSTPEELAWQQLRPYLLDPRENYPEPYHLLEYNGVPFGKLGGLGAMSGQKKNGKSFVFTCLIAAIVGDGCERVQQYLPGLRVPERTIEYLGHKPKTLYIDTEMEKLSSAKVMRRVHWLCGVDMNQPFPEDRFTVVWLKNMPKDSDIKPHQKRYQLIKLAIDMIKPDVVFIDGIRDLLSSINDEEAGTQILEELASLAEERQMSIWNALHQNPSRNNDAEDAKMRGWIGTELGNKVSDTLVSIKSKTASGVTFTVKQQDARDKDLEDWKFEITDDAGNLGIPKIIGSGSNLSTKKEIQPDSNQEILRWINEGKGRHNWPMDRKSIKELIFKEIGGVTRSDQLQADLMAAIRLGYLEESTLKKNGYPMLQPPEDLPF